MKASQIVLALFGSISSVGAASLPWPVSSTYNSLNPEASSQFMIDFMGAVKIQPNISSDCSESSWVTMPGSGYEFHFISTPNLSTPNFSFSDYVAYVEPWYGNLSETTSSNYDQFMDHHVGMITDDMTGYYEALTAGKVRTQLWGHSLNLASYARGDLLTEVILLTPKVCLWLHSCSKRSHSLW